MRPFAAAAATDDTGGTLNPSWGKAPEQNFDIKVVFVSARGANHTPRHAGFFFGIFSELALVYLIRLQENYGLGTVFCASRVISIR